MYTFLVVLYVIVCLFLIFVVLLQPGRGGMGGAFGAGMSQQVFGGGGGTNVLQKVTAICAALFMGLSVALAFMSSRRGGGLDDAIESVESDGGGTSMAPAATAPAAPAAPVEGLVPAPAEGAPVETAPVETAPVEGATDAPTP